MSAGQGPSQAEATPIYLNTDLEIEWTGDLSPLVDALAAQTAVLYNGPAGATQRLTLELLEAPEEVSEAVSAFCALIERLPENAMLVWDAADSRIIDIGYESGVGKQFAKTIIEPDLLHRVAQIGACIAITVYPVMQDPGHE